MIGACLTTTATKWSANAARPIAVAFLPAKIGSGPNCRHAIKVISPLTLPIRSWHALAENASLSQAREVPQFTKFANAVFWFCDRFSTNDNHQEMHCGYRLASLRAAIASSFSRCHHRGQRYRRRKRASAGSRSKALLRATLFRRDAPARLCRASLQFCDDRGRADHRARAVKDYSSKPVPRPTLSPTREKACGREYGCPVPASRRR